jgi:hypothetical protein
VPLPDKIADARRIARQPNARLDKQSNSLSRTSRFGGRILGLGPATGKQKNGREYRESAH